MTRYRLITSDMTPGAYREFTSADDAEALIHARSTLYGAARIVSLTAKEYHPRFGEVHRRVDTKDGE